MSSNANPIATITEAVVTTLREDLLMCRLTPGQRLSIKDLAAGYEASPGAVREALSRLAAEGLVVAEAQRGFTVARVSADDLVQLTDARILIETTCLREAIAHADLQWESGIIELLHRLSKVEPGDGDVPVTQNWLALHAEFHRQLTATCPNPYFRQTAVHLAALAQRYHLLSTRIAEPARRPFEEHRQIADAAIARDADLAAALLARHLRQTMDTVLASLDANLSSAAQRTPVADASTGHVLPAKLIPASKSRAD
ncbi:GntR family transcriptional regulator [Sphingobium sp.]|uniref:GntR family transcriptional regulator n=1 Tax=Sphingobium sp. TaxID=1912891 RepID=UPI0028BE02A1|nr:GntR family transcriptional regulator [Sphingobium sp.]